MRTVHGSIDKRDLKRYVESATLYATYTGDEGSMELRGLNGTLFVVQRSKLGTYMGAFAATPDDPALTLHELGLVSTHDLDLLSREEVEIVKDRIATYARISKEALSKRAS